MSYHVLLVCGGNGSEHEISLISASYVEEKLKSIPEFKLTYAVLDQGQFKTREGETLIFDDKGNMLQGESVTHVDVVIPCLHGKPGETGDIQSFFNLHQIPSIGCQAQSSRVCFNKVLTKLCLTAFDIPNTPFVILGNFDEENLNKAFKFFEKEQDVYVKAASQGSSIGCYHVQDLSELKDSIAEAFAYSDSVIIEKTIPHRELEVAAFEIDGKIQISTPGEIIMPSDVFYTYDEKYSKSSGTVTTVEPKGLDPQVIEQIRSYAYKAFVYLKMQDLCRIDFFLSDKGEVILNEANTFPGMTPISMFPKLVEHMGYDMAEFFKQAVMRAINRGPVL